MRTSKERAESLPSRGLVASALGCLLAGLLLTLLTRPIEAQAATRPNFVVIQTDDQTLDSMRALYRSRSGAMRAVMPNTKRLLRQGGFEFTRAHTATPLCAPSRASLLTGQYPHNHGLTQNGGESGGWIGWQALSLWEDNLPVTLRRSGYRTIQVGKFTNEYRGEPGRGYLTDIPPGWSRWVVPTDRYHRRFDRTFYYRYRLNVQGRVKGPIGRRSTERDDCWFGPRRAPRGREACGHLTDRTTYLANREIERSRKPFFLSVSYSTPHIEWLGPGTGDRGLVGPAPSARHEGTAAGTRLPRSPSFNERDFSDKPDFVRDFAPRLRKPKVRELARYYRRYLESLRGVDDGIGALFAGLRRSGELGNTFVFFTSDNGVFLGEHRFEPSKFLPYEPTVRVPLLVRGPRVPQWDRSPAPVSLVDVAPTIADLAGVDLGYEVDGTSLRPLWRDSTALSDRPILFEAGDLGGEAADRSLRARAPYRPSAGIRVGRWKFIRYGGGEFELYDLKEDPAELRNLSADPRYSDVSDDLLTALRRYEDCAGDDCREEIAVPPLPPLPPLPPIP